MSRLTSPFLLLPLALLCAAPAWGQSVHKCTDASGRISYSDRPCATAPPAAAAATTRPATVATVTRPATVAAATVSPSPAAALPATAASGATQRTTAMPVAVAPVRPATDEADADLAARRAAAAQTTDCNASVRQMAQAGSSMRLVDAGQARSAAIVRCGGG